MAGERNREEAGPSAVNPHDPAAGGSKKGLPIRVLYIDDEPALLDPIRHYLVRKGTFSVDTATSAQEGLEKLRATKYDVIVSDYQMPVMDGIELLRKLRDEGNLIPFIIFTGKGHEEVVVEAYNAGADFYIPKGGNPKAMFLDLTQKITQIVTRRRSEEALFESEERYRKVVEQSHDAIFIYQGTRLAFFNDRVLEISGYSRAELEAMDVWTIIHPEDRGHLATIEKLHNEGAAVPKTYETRILTKNGATRFLEIAITALATNGRSSILGSARDITDRKEAEESLRRSEEKYHTIFNSFDDLYYQTDMQGIITILSPSCKKITGWDASELIGLQVLDLYPFPEQRKELLDLLLRDGEVHDYQVILRNRNGDHLDTSVTSHVVRDADGKPVAIEGTLRNITERIRVEKALHASEERYRTLADFLPVMVFETDLFGILTFENRLVFDVFGVSQDDIGKINVVDYIVPEERERARANMKKLFAGLPRSSHEYFLIAKDGTRFPTMVTASPILDERTGTPVGMRGVIIDLTELKNAEKALRESEDLFRTLFNNANDAIFLHEVQPDLNPGRYIMVNDIACSRMGYTREELLALSPFDVVSASHKTKMPSIIRSLTKAGHFTFDAIHKKKDGTEFPVEISTHIFELHGRTVALSIARDITERKQMEETIRTSEQRLHAIIDGAATPLFVIGRDHRVLYWNNALERYCGIRERDVIGTPDAWKAFYETKRPVLADLLIDNAIDRIPAWYEGKYQESVHTKGAYEATDFFPRLGTSGTWLHFTAVVIRDGSGEIIGALETLEDVSERRKAEEELKSSENYLKTIFNAVQTALVVIDPADYHIVDVNPAAVALMEADRDRIVGSVCTRCFCPAKDGKCPFAGHGHTTDAGEGILLSLKGKKVPVFKTVIPVSIAGRSYILETIMDITDRKRAEDAMQEAFAELELKVEERTLALSDLTRSLQREILERNRIMDALRVSEEKYRSLVEQTNDLVFQVDKDGNFTYISPNVSAILGYEVGQVMGKNPAEFMPDADRPLYRQLHERNNTEQKAVSGIELTFFDRENRPHIFEINGSPHTGRDGGFLGFSGIARDITDKKALQEAIAASLKEKEILLKEIHHRVKNNMQVISSLLSLQAKMIKDQKSREAIKESQNRVMSISLVHEKLYQSRSLARINYRDYISKMAENLFDSYSIHADKVRLEISADDIVLPINKAIPVSLLINELLSNSLKYAFPDDRRGLVQILFRKDGDRHILTVRDDGIGLPPGIRMDQTETLGLQLVSSLVGQLDGKITVHGESGAEFIVEFTVEPPSGDRYD